MQVHGVPNEERMLSETASVLPFACRNASPAIDARTARSDRDDAPFGKARSGRSGTRALSKPVDPNVLGFGSSYAYSYGKQEAHNTSRHNNDSRRVPSMDAQNRLVRDETILLPSQCLIRGFFKGRQWAAIDHFERFAGRICETYPRYPPSCTDQLGTGSSLRFRPWTDAERQLASKHISSDTWVKVTFESFEAAEKAMDNPQEIDGVEVVAVPFHPRDLERLERNVTPAAPTKSTIGPLPPQSLSPQGPPTGNDANPKLVRYADEHAHKLKPGQSLLLPKPSPWQNLWASILCFFVTTQEVPPHRRDHGFVWSAGNVWWRFWYLYALLFDTRIFRSLQESNQGDNQKAAKILEMSPPSLIFEHVLTVALRILFAVVILSMCPIGLTETYLRPASFLQSSSLLLLALFVLTRSLTLVPAYENHSRLDLISSGVAESPLRPFILIFGRRAVINTIRVILTGIYVYFYHIRGVTCPSLPYLTPAVTLMSRGYICPVT